MEKSFWNDLVKNEKVLHRFKVERTYLNTMKRRKGKRIGHTLHRNCLLKWVNEGNIEEKLDVTLRRRRRRKQIMDNLE